MKKTRFSVLLALLLGILTITLWWSCQTPTDIVEIQPPAAPTGLTATPVSQTQINLSWTDNSTNEDYFEIYKLANNQLVQVATSAANATSYSFTGSCGIAYKFHIVATNAGGTSAASNTASATTDQCTPGVPTGLTATPVSQTQINLSWTASSGATSYKIYQVTSDHAFIYIGSTSITSYPVTGLSCDYVDPYTGTGYRFIVTASNAGGTSGFSNTVIATTDACTPGAVTIGSASPTSQTAMTVTWTRNSPFTETGFKIYQYQPELDPLRGTAGAGATSGSVTDLSPSTSYRFYVRAYVVSNGRTYHSRDSGISNGITTTP